MGKNTGKGFRQGTVIERTQVYNPTTEQYVKRDCVSGKFVSSKDTPYKGVRKEESATKKSTK